MSDKEKMKKAFQNLKAPEDTLERVMETMSRKELRENMRSGQSAPTMRYCRKSFMILR